MEAESSSENAMVARLSPVMSNPGASPAMTIVSAPSATSSCSEVMSIVVLAVVRPMGMVMSAVASPSAAGAE